MKREICGNCGESVLMDYEKEHESNTLIGAYITCPECGATSYQGRP